MSFIGGVVNVGERISWVRFILGSNIIEVNGVFGNMDDDVVVMDDFFYVEFVFF